jgi:ubiquinone biosynthesis protein COQ9
VLSKVEFVESLIKSERPIKWNESFISRHCHHLGLDPKYYRILFIDGGVREISAIYHSLLDSKMLTCLSAMDKPKRVRDMIALALEIRIIGLNDRDIDLLMSTKSFWSTVDKIWKYAGDQSADFNYYTKRGILYGLYLRVKNQYIKDNSSDYINTKKAIPELIDGVLKISQIKRKIPNKDDIPFLRML